MGVIHCDKMDNNQLAFDFALHTNRNLFITGKAGTGKTTFLRRLKEISGKQMAVVAPTGVAAINAGGTTIHSFFQLPLTPFFPTPEGRKQLISQTRMRGHRRRVLQELELLVIDEISMVRADLLDAIDASLRHFRYRSDQLFGGVQVIFIGDMFQLSPVAKEDEWRLLSEYYPSPYFFHSRAIMQDLPVYIEFEKIYRQTNSDFIRVLNEIRNDCLSPESFRMLEKRYDPLFTPRDEDDYIVLTTHNYKADQINTRELAKLKGKAHKFSAKIEGDYPEKNYPTEPELELKPGAKVMFLRNDTEAARFYNGKTGVVDRIDGDTIIVCCNGNEYIEVERTPWENIGYSANPETKQIEENTLGRFIQYPLRLAWAITIHKSQGLTFDKVMIDAGQAFAPGQIYVALSRCRSLEGIVLLSKIHPDSIRNDRQIIDHEKNKLTVDVLETQLEESRNAYRSHLLLSIFDFMGILTQVRRLSSKIKEWGESFNDETQPYLRNIQQQLEETERVAAKFQVQLNSIIRQQPLREDYLKDRLSAAGDFFMEKIDLLIEELRQSPASTDSRAHAAEYNEAIQDVFSDLALKKHLLGKFKSDTTIEAYFEAKNNFRLPSFSVNAYAISASTKSDLSHPGLYRLLVEERNNICGPRDLPIYLVAGSKTLYEMAEYLPQNKKELLQITGFGPAKVEKYGQAFLSIIQDYCERHGLESRLTEKGVSRRKQKEKKEKKEKKKKGDSRRLSLEMFRSGKTIEEIAEERNLAISTIGTHLAKYVETGELVITDFIPRERLRLAEEKLRTASPDDPVYYTLQPDFSNTEIMVILAHKRRGGSESSFL
ncbi:UvrD-like helicase C-terminal domain-containing protein [Porphyromonadaceae bacterium NLAE-zl-C104]|nr:UvrD-like helicase C-terminal domain-containing protein [Porphyromonadaceae bacterium KH3R12]SFS30001.1 UvrD-like helicase C-terminal domain-containing protein [Porphyromonadaceae bacterium NLAE-zl-C104]